MIKTNGNFNLPSIQTIVKNIDIVNVTFEDQWTAFVTWVLDSAPIDLNRPLKQLNDGKLPNCTTEHQSSWVLLLLEALVFLPVLVGVLFWWSRSKQSTGQVCLWHVVGLSSCWVYRAPICAAVQQSCLEATLELTSQVYTHGTTVSSSFLLVILSRIYNVTEMLM